LRDALQRDMARDIGEGRCPGVREAPQSSMGCTEDRGETGGLLKESKILKQCRWYKEIQLANGNKQ
jgi:hypothetical protein